MRLFDDVFPLFGGDEEEPVVWWRGREDATPVLALPQQWQRFATSTGFLLARVTMPDADGLVYADAHEPLSVSQFANFRALCSLLQARLDESVTRS